MNGESPLKLAYLISRYPAISHAFILREIRCLRQLGITIDVASINPPDRSAAQLTVEEQEEAASTFYVKSAGLRGALVPHLATLLSRPFSYLRGLVSALRLGGADLIKIAYGLFYFVEAVMIGRWMTVHGLAHLHVHFATPASTVALITSRIFPITFSVTVHGPDEFYDIPGYRLPQKIVAARFMCCIGTYARSQLMKISPPTAWDKLEVVPLGVDPSAFMPRPLRQDPAAFEVLCVGRLVPAKGQYILLAAIAQLVRAGRKMRLRLIGDGPDRSGLEAAVASSDLGGSVIFEGAVNQERIRSFYATADVFALASFAEGIPVALMEAMAMEIPCVSTCIAGIPELIRDGIDGLLVPPSDGIALARAIATLMDDAALRQRIAQAGRRRILAKYDLNRNAMNLAAVFRERLRGSPCS
jgi:colanic acid/amylovoran biosynthesis glycosyltransferase